MVQTPTQALPESLTLEQFLTLPETKPASEYIDGKIFQKPMPQGEHSTLQGDLVTAINAVLKPKKVGRTYPEQCLEESMNPTDYKHQFDASWQLYHASDSLDIDLLFEPELADDEVPDLPDLPLATDIALEMLEAQVTYWEHYGWVAACAQKLESMVYQSAFEHVNELSAWLIASAPKGVAEQYPQLSQYAMGEFPVAEVQHWQAQGQWWREQQARSQTATSSSGLGNNISLQGYCQLSATASPKAKDHQ